MEQNAKKAETEYIEDVDRLESMLQTAYQKESVPEDVNIRLRNQIKCREVMGESTISFWWLPATVSTVISAAIGLILVVLYFAFSTAGTESWMPNLVSHISSFWLNINLAVLLFEVALSWIVTFIGLWKGNFRKSARI